MRKNRTGRAGFWDSSLTLGGLEGREESVAAVAEYVRGMFQWTVKREGIIAPDERPPAPQSLALGLQHIFAMFGATVLAPILMGFDPNTAIFFSGIGTLIFF